MNESGASLFDAFAMVVTLVLFIFAYSYLKLHPFHFLQNLFTEFSQLFRGQITTGAVNALGLIFVFVMGVFILLDDTFGFLLSLVERLFRPERAEEYVSSVSSFTLLITLVFLATLSIVCTLIDALSRKR
jgi:hypothetical protein